LKRETQFLFQWIQIPPPAWKNCNAYGISIW
jgi:hypothetical protein